MNSLVRIANAGVPGSEARVDIVLKDGKVASVSPAGLADGRLSVPVDASAAETTIDADGLWAIPGLWDCHTHFTQWSKTLGDWT